MRPVLAVVDVQKGFIRGESAPLVPRIVELVARWQDAGGDVLFTRFWNYPNSPFERLVGWTAMTGQPETDLVPELAPALERPHTVADKRSYGLFADSRSAQVVDKHKWTDIYVCGIATESCVLATAVETFERGLTPWVISDACVSHAGATAHEAGMLVIERFIGARQVLTARDAVQRALEIELNGGDPIARWSSSVAQKRPEPVVGDEVVVQYGPGRIYTAVGDVVGKDGLWCMVRIAGEETVRVLPEQLEPVEGRAGSVEGRAGSRE